MKIATSLMALVACLGLATASMAQDAPAGGPDAKGNAPLKHAHTVNDGSAKPGANSFTQNEARKHILNSGYMSVTGLVKGKDGVWRGMASKGGANVNVALDFKGNVTEGGAVNAAPLAKSAPATATTTATTTAAATTTSDTKAAGPAEPTTTASTTHRRHHRGRHHRHHHHALTKCGTPGPDGVACSGADRNRDGIADKDEKAAH